MNTAEEQLEQLKFPIGPFRPKESITREDLDQYIETIATAPARYRAITAGLSEDDLKKTYREGSWNVQQIVNHVADMHLLHFFRMKCALTDPDYKNVTLVNQDAWTRTPDGLNGPVLDALDVIESITKRMVFLIRSLDERQLAITYYHPVRRITLSQKQAVSMTAWHVAHHLEHLKIALHPG